MQARIQALLDGLRAAEEPELAPQPDDGTRHGTGVAGAQHDYAFTHAELARTPTQTRRAERDMPDMLAEMEAATEQLCMTVSSVVDQKRRLLEQVRRL